MIAGRAVASTRVTPAMLLLAVAGACGKPKVTAIEIAPSEVMVGSEGTPTTFQVEARLWTGSAAERTSIDEADGYNNLHWKVDPVSQSWLTVTGNGFHATVTVAPNAAPAGPGFITVEAGGKTTQPGA